VFSDASPPIGIGDLLGALPPSIDVYASEQHALADPAFQTPSRHRRIVSAESQVRALRPS
jgi:hypothetical protein